MALFTSSKEKRLWMYVGLVVIAIFSTLTFSKPLQKLVVDQNIQAVFFVVAMLLIGIAIIIYGLKVQASTMELTTWFGFMAIFILLVFRLGASERSHLIEYSVLAIFIHQALKARNSNSNKWLITAVIAFGITVCIGALDEGLQLIIPNRDFDPVDMLFNTVAAFFTISVILILEGIQKKFRNN